jgi:tetraacyldisaccharide 4'-kinase
MSMDEPFVRRWWNGQLGTAGTVLNVLLAPAELLYRAGVATRNRAFDTRMFEPQRAPLPVVSIGNIAVGGTGKTPLAQHIARLLVQRGARPAILHGGYGNDEPELHRYWSIDIPVFVDPVRVRAARMAHVAGASIVVLDDGFQHRALQRDLDIVLVAAETWQERLRLLPRGPLREPRSALRRAHLVVVTRKTASAGQAAVVQRDIEDEAGVPVVRVHLQSSGWLHDARSAPAPAQAAVAVAAIAEPERFAESARLAGARVTTVLRPSDHYDYSFADARDILHRAGDGAIVTTEKDWMKLQFLLPPERVWLLTQRVHIEQGADVLAARLDELVRAHA